MRCSPAVRPRVHETRTRPVESVVRMLSSTLPWTGNSVTGTPGTGFLARSSTRSSTSGFSTLLTEPSRLATATTATVAARPACAVALTTKRGTARGLPTCTYARWAPDWGPRVQRARASPSESVRDSDATMLPSSSADHATGTSARATPLESVTRTTTGSGRAPAGRPLEILAHLSQAGVGTDRLGFGSDDRVAGHSFGADRQRLTPGDPAESPGRSDDALGIGGAGLGVCLPGAFRENEPDRNAFDRPAHCARRPEPLPDRLPAAPPVHAARRRPAASARQAPGTPRPAAG